MSESLWINTPAVDELFEKRLGNPAAAEVRNYLKYVRQFGYYIVPDDVSNEVIGQYLVEYGKLIAGRRREHPGFAHQNIGHSYRRQSRTRNFLISLAQILRRQFDRLDGVGIPDRVF